MVIFSRYFLDSDSIWENIWDGSFSREIKITLSEHSEKHRERSRVSQMGRISRITRGIRSFVPLGLSRRSRIETFVISSSVCKSVTIIVNHAGFSHCFSQQPARTSFLRLFFPGVHRLIPKCIATNLKTKVQDITM